MIPENSHSIAYIKLNDQTIQLRKMDGLTKEFDQVVKLSFIDHFNHYFLLALL